jgi:flagellar protein FliO/FliZ
MTSVRGLRIAFAVPVLIFVPLMGLAAEAAVPATMASPLAGALQMLFALGIVLAAIAGMAWLLRRMSPGQAGSASDLRVVAAVAVGPKERVVLVDVADTRLVLGVAPGQVTKLMEMPRPEITEALPATVPPFVDKLKAVLTKRRGEQ